MRDKIAVIKLEKAMLMFLLAQFSLLIISGLTFGNYRSVERIYRSTPKNKTCCIILRQRRNLFVASGKKRQFAPAGQPVQMQF